MQRIGVFVCHCGSNIAATVDVKKVVEIIAKEPGVVHAEDYQYMCSEAGQSRIQEAIREKNLTGVVVCSCSPRMHEATFRKAAEKAGLNPYMVEIANIREHCSWIHKDMPVSYTHLVKEGDQVTVVMNEHVEHNGKQYPIASLPENLMDIIQAGGLVKAMRKLNGLD